MINGSHSALHNAALQRMSTSTQLPKHLIAECWRLPSSSLVQYIVILPPFHRDHKPSDSERLDMGTVRAGFLKGWKRMVAQRSAPDLGRRYLTCSYSTSSFNEFPELNNVGDDHQTTNTKRGIDVGSGNVDPRRGWEFRGVYKAFLCGKVGESPVQKILRDGRTVTIFTVGTGGLFDQRIVGGNDVPRPPQWHRVAVLNESLGNYAVRQLVKDSSVFVEGDIETRVYNDSITGQVKNIPEIVVGREGKVRLIKSGNGASNLSLDELREGLL